ncbi:Membrane dipeptidase (Peptidase family M19) [Streptomyces sp. YIM 130001]|uniref:membrane dipeptidase n=1 Tax=Streptomyces sp. YIM 130001 TaxID=2259644 RepID=UPI000E653207|nr:membrane dipeptidase [Streptomyces sp. YIM 130001]RII15115.1 Membrane dipeptidase (Peptidase family M19) [Streptomyces sp. YIM 130001]
MADLQDEAHATGEVGDLDPPRAARATVAGDERPDDAAAPEHEPDLPPDDGGPPPGASPRDRVRAVLARHPVADGHSGLLWALGRLSWYDLELGESALQTDIPRLREGAVGTLFWSLEVPGDFAGDRAVCATLDLIDLAGSVVRDHPEGLWLARTSSEVADARAHGRIACLLGPASATALGNSLGALRALHQLGVRTLSLSGTRWAGEEGLSRFGEEVVREMNRLGVIADLTGSADATVHRVMAVSRGPSLFSHSGARALTDHPDNASDEVLTALRTGRGLCMVPCAAAQTGDALRDVADHLDHVRRVAGPECVGLAGGFDTDGPSAAGIADPAAYPLLLGELLERGWSDAELALLTSENLQRVIRDADFTARATQLRRAPSTATIERLDG